MLCPQKDNKNTKRNKKSSHHWSTQIDYAPANIPEPSYRAKLLILVYNDAVIKMTVKWRSPALRHVPRMHRIDLDWLFERIREDRSIDIRHVNTKLQIADFLTKATLHPRNGHRCVIWPAVSRIKLKESMLEENPSVKLLWPTSLKKKQNVTHLSQRNFQKGFQKSAQNHKINAIMDPHVFFLLLRLCPRMSANCQNCPQGAKVKAQGLPNDKFWTRTPK